MYGLDIGYGGDFGAVTQKDTALVLLACSAPLVGLEAACLFANATDDTEGELAPQQHPNWKAIAR